MEKGTLERSSSIVSAENGVKPCLQERPVAGGPAVDRTLG